METKVAVLRWIHELHQKLPNRVCSFFFFFFFYSFCEFLASLNFFLQMSQHIEELFPLLLRSLSDRSDKVVHCDLKVLSEIISSPNLSDSKAQVTGMLSFASAQTRIYRLEFISEVHFYLIDLFFYFIVKYFIIFITLGKKFQSYNSVAKYTYQKILISYFVYCDIQCLIVSILDKIFKIHSIFMTVEKMCTFQMNVVKFWLETRSVIHELLKIHTNFYSRIHDNSVNVSVRMCLWNGI